MEDLLDNIRKGTLAVNSEVVDCLLQGLDALKILKEDAAGGKESAIEVAELAVRLRSVRESAAEAPADEVTKPADIAAAEDAAAMEVLRSQAGDQSAYKVRISIDEHSQWPSVRCFQALDALAALGDVVKSVPSREEIEAEKGARQLEAIFLTSSTTDDIKAALQALEDIRQVDVEKLGAAGRKRFAAG